MPVSEVYNIDCMEYMKGVPDKYFDLAIVDPPYGIGAAAGKTFSSHHSQKKYQKKDWDNDVPDLDFFKELIRVSKNQVIWGANHFTDKLPISTSWIYWDKDNYSDFSDGELAWTSHGGRLRAVKIVWNGFRGKEPGGRVHPTQKPIKLYRWVLDNYSAKTGEGLILDTHMGSQSSRIAAFQMGFDYVGCELDKDYFDAGNKRFNLVTSQQQLFI